MPGPSRYNRRLKKKNDRRSRARSAGGRTPSEAGLGRSMAAQGNAVSRSNQRVGGGYRAPGLSAPVVSPAQSRQIRERKREQEAKRNIESVRNRISQSRKAADSRAKDSTKTDLPKAAKDWSPKQIAEWTATGNKRPKKQRRSNSPAAKERRARVKLGRASRRADKIRTRTVPTRLALGGASLSRKLPKPGLRTVKRNKKQQLKAQQQLKQQEKRLGNRQTELQEIRAVREIVPDKIGRAKLPENKRDRQRIAKRTTRVVNAYLGDTPEARAARKAGTLPRQKVPKPSEGGRTVAEATRAIDAAATRGVRPQVSNVKVAKGEWKKVGGLPKVKGKTDRKFIQETAFKVSNPEAFDTRGPSGEEILKDGKTRKEFLANYSRSTFDQASKAKLPVGRKNRNPWAISDMQAPENETPEERREREAEVLARLLRFQKGSPAQRLDATAIQRTIDAAREGGVLANLIDAPAWERQGLDPLKLLLDDPVKFVKRGPDSWGAAGFFLRNQGIPGISPRNPNILKVADLQQAADLASIAVTVSTVYGLGALTRGGAGMVRTFGKAAISKNEAGKRVGIKGGMAAAVSSTRPGQAYLSAVNRIDPTIWRGIRAGTGVALTGAAFERGYAAPFIEGTVEANVLKSTSATARGLLAAITQPVAWAAAGIGTARRATDAISGSDPYYSSKEYIAAPLTRLFEETWKELESMAETFTSKDANRIRKATENDFGYVTLLSVGWLSRLTVGQALKSGGGSINTVAKQIARTPAGMQIAKQIYETKGLGRTVKAVGAGIAGGRAIIERRREAAQAQLASGRFIGEQQFRTARFNKAVVTPMQSYNTADLAAGGRVRAAVNKFNKQQARAYGDSTATPPPLTVADVFSALARRGLNPLKMSELEMRQKIRTIRDNLPRTDAEYRALTLAFEEPRIWRIDSSPRSKFGQKLYEGLENNDEMLGIMRVLAQEGTDAGMRQMLTDRETKATQILANVSKLTGEKMGETPREEQARLQEERAAQVEELALETESIRTTVEQLAEELDVERQTLEPLVATERAAIREEIKGTPLEEDLRATSERLLSLELRDRDIPQQIADNRKLIVAAKREAQRDYPPVSKKEREQIEQRVSELREENRQLSQRRAEAGKLSARLRYLEKVAAKTIGKPNPAIVRIRKRMDRYKGEIARLEALPKMAQLRELERKVFGEMTDVEVAALIETMDPVIKAALRQRNGLEASLAEIDAEISESRATIALNEVADELIRGGEAQMRGLDQMIAEGEAFLSRLTAKREPGDSPLVGHGVSDPELVAKYLKDEYGIEIPPEEVKRAAQAQIDAATEFVDKLRELKAFVNDAVMNNGGKRKALKALKAERAELNARLPVLSKSQTRLESQREHLIGKGGGDAMLEEAKERARRAIVESFELTEYKALVTAYEQDASKARIDHNLQEPIHMVQDRQDSGRDIPVAPEAQGTMAMAREQRRTGALEEEGLVDPSFDQIQKAYQAEAERLTYQHISQYIARHGLIAVKWPDGSIRTVFAEDELELARELYKKQTGLDLDDIGFVMDRRTFDEAGRFGTFMENVRGSSNRLRREGLDELQVKAAEEANLSNYRDGLGVHVIHDPVFDGPVRAAARRGETLRGEEGFVLVKQTSIDTFRRLQMELTTFEAFFFQLNRIASRLVLGTSLSWMFAQPFAELAVLLAQHPMRTWTSLAEVKKLRREGGEAAMALSRIAQTTPGPNPAASQRTRLGTNQAQRDFATATGFFKKLPQLKMFDHLDAERPMNRGAISQFGADLVTLRGPGIFDRWKSGMIREAGVLAELDMNLSDFARAGKAVRGQIDLIEVNANKLAKMTRQEQLAWLNSQEGFDVGMELAKKIDDQLGNWQDLRPGFESAIGQVIFFYPFVRFSLQWALKTYPRDHPVVWTLGSVLGVANSEMLEELVNYDPAWPQEWAVVPYFGDPSDGSAPTSLINVSRYTTAGNAISELAMSQGDPIWNAMNVTVPLWTLAGRFVFKTDEFGNPLTDSDDNFMDPNPSLPSRFGALLDQFLSLTTQYREVTNATGFSFQGLLGPDGDATEFRREIGVDPDVWRDRIRRNILPAIPMPMHVIRDKQQLANIVGRQIAARAATTSYTFEGKTTVKIKGPNGKMRELDFQRVGQALIGDRKAQDEIGITTARTPREREIARAYLKILRQNAEARDALEGATEAERKQAYRLGAAIDPEGAAWSEKMATQRSETATRWNEWEDKFPGRPYPDTEDEAKKALKALENNGLRLNRNDGKGLAAPDSKTNPKEQEKGQTLTERLRASTRARLEEKGMRRVSLSDPTVDPETKVNKKGNVTRYRGRKVAGDVTVKELREAEESNALDIDTKSDLLRTPRIQGLQDGQRAKAAEVKRLKRVVNRLTTTGGGVPSGVPKKYRKAIGKWGEYLEKEMKKNGLVGVDGGLPKGMSGAEYLAKIIQAESGWDERIGHPDNTSSAQAQGLGQFIPSTRDSFLEQYGVDAYGNAAQQIKAAAFHLDGNHTAGGLGSYNPGFPDDSDGTWGYYLDQNVGEVRPGKRVPATKLAGKRSRLKDLQAQLKEANAEAKKAGLPPVRVLDRPTLWAQPKDAKGKPSIEWLNGTTSDSVNPDIVRLGYTISKMTGQDLQITSALRPGDSDSNHSEGGALDIGAVADGGEGEKRGDAIAYAAVIAAGGTKEDAQALASGSASIVQFTSPNGHSMELLWKGDPDHRDHVHIAVEQGSDRGQRVFRGRRVIGQGVLQNGVSSTGSYTGSSGGGGGSMATGGGGGVMSSYSDALDEWVGMDLGPVEYGGGGMSYEEGGVDPAVVQAADVSSESGSGDSVKSAAEQLASLPKVQKKKKVPRFDPSNRI